VCVCACVCVRVCVCVCVRMYTHTYIHVHAYLHSSNLLHNVSLRMCCKAYVQIKRYEYVVKPSALGRVPVDEKERKFPSTFAS